MRNTDTLCSTETPWPCCLSSLCLWMWTWTRTSHSQTHRPPCRKKSDLKHTVSHLKNSCAPLSEQKELTHSLQVALINLHAHGFRQPFWSPIKKLSRSQSQSQVVLCFKHSPVVWSLDMSRYSSLSGSGSPKHKHHYQNSVKNERQLHWVVL